MISKNKLEFLMKIIIFSLRFLQDYWELDKIFDIQEYLLLEICSKIMFLGSKVRYRYPIHYPELRNFFGVDEFGIFSKKQHQKSFPVPDDGQGTYTLFLNLKTSFLNRSRAVVIPRYQNVYLTPDSLREISKQKYRFFMKKV